MKRKLFLLFFLFSLSCNLGAQSTNQLDSLRTDIFSKTDSAYFSEWTYKLADVSQYNSVEQNQITDWFLERSAQLNYPVLNAKFKFRKSILKTITGDYKEALELIDEALPYLDSKNEALWLAACYNSSGGMIAVQGNVEQGVTYLKKAIALVPFYRADSALKKRALSNHYNGLGNIYANNNQLDSALKYITKSYELAKQAGEYGTKERCFGQLNLAKVFLKAKDYELALSHANKVLKEAEVNNYGDIKCMSLYKAASAYEGLNKYDSAFYYYNLALNRSQLNQLKETETNLLRDKAYLSLKLEHFEEAAKIFEEYSRKKSEQLKRNHSASASYLIKRTKEADQIRNKLEKAQIKTEEKLKIQKLWVFFMIIISIVLVFGVIFYFRNQKKTFQQKLEAEKIEKELVKSLIRTINSQMNPHFVFNALNSVQDLILLKDIRNSNIYLGKFADLMRKTLDYSQEGTISLNQELETIKLYLDLEKLRFGEDFNFKINSTLNDEELENTPIPSLLLQPYIENAIKHGLLHKTGEKHLKIKIFKIDSKLSIAIIDNGIGRKKSKEINQRRDKNHTSFAMRANDQRLKLVKESLGIDISIDISDVAPSGTQILFTFN